MAACAQLVDIRRAKHNTCKHYDGLPLECVTLRVAATPCVLVNGTACRRNIAQSCASSVGSEYEREINGSSLLDQRASACTPRLAKRIFGGMQLVVLLGEESTGHHGVCVAISPRCAAQPAAPCFAHDASLLSRVERLSLANDAASLRQARASVGARLRHLQSAPSAAHLQRVVFQCSAFDASVVDASMMSYPDMALAARGRLPSALLGVMDAVAIAEVRRLMASIDPRLA
jgi:hypothetical protein